MPGHNLIDVWQTSFAIILLIYPDIKKNPLQDSLAWLVFITSFHVAMKTFSCRGQSQGPFLSLARSKLRLCSDNHRIGYFSNLDCDWPSKVWAYSEQETENGPRPHHVDVMHCKKNVGCQYWTNEDLKSTNCNNMNRCCSNIIFRGET